MKALQGWISAAHPFPLAMVLLLTVLIAVASSDGRPAGAGLALVVTAMLTSQLAIGWSNDYLDRDLDAVHQPSKPLPSRLVQARLMPPAIGVALVVSAGSGALLGVVPILLLAAGTSCGLAYNFWLKRTRFSAAPYVLAFTVLPLFVWTALHVYRDAYLALYGIAVALPVAAHIANVLPDLDTDRAQERRTIAVALGRTRAVALALACLLAPLPLTAVSALWLDYETSILIPTLLVYGLLTTATGACYTVVRGRAGDVWAFRCLTGAAVVFAGGWLASV